MSQTTTPQPGSVLGYFLDMRRGIGFPSHGNVLEFLKRQQWSNGDISLADRIGEKFEVLPPDKFARQLRIHDWVPKLDQITEATGDVITQAQLVDCAPELYRRTYPNPRTAISTAFDLYWLFFSADRTSNLTVSVDDDAFVTTEVRKYLPPTPNRWRMLRRCSHEPTRIAVRKAYLTFYLPLLRNVVGRMAVSFPRSEELHDLINEAIFGLAGAFDRYDPDRGAKFETFAVPRIRGAVLDYLRNKDWAPRSVRSNNRKYYALTLQLNQLAAEMGCAVPTYEQIAENLGITYEQVVQHFVDVQHAGAILSTDELIFREEDNRQVPRIETIASPLPLQDAQISWRQLWNFVQYVMRTHLTPQERAVLDSYYFAELRLVQIGRLMQISESRVSQIRTKAVAKLKSYCVKGLQIEGSPQRWYEEFVLGN